MGVVYASTIGSPEFINVTSISPEVSKCEIKVLYIGENRNYSSISKEVATKMAESLPGCMIVGYYSEKHGDFRDHGEVIKIDGDGIEFQCQTKPYGFVAPDSKIWFQKFNEIDSTGKATEREYLMTEGYLWTGQFPECKSAVENHGKPHSMELDDKFLDGYWAIDENRGVEFFIINDAVISKLCILGDDVEPCFEGSTITAPALSAQFTKQEANANFNKSLFDMMEQLKFALNQNKGGNTNMPGLDDNTNPTPIVEPIPTPTPDVDPTVVIPTPEDIFKKDDKKEENKPEDDGKDNAPKLEDDEEDKKKKEKVEKNTVTVDNADEVDKEKFELLQKDYESLQQKFTALESSYNELVAFKNQIEDEKKNELIASFYMLSDEDKKDVIENKSKFSLDEIKSKLSVICFDKKVNFSENTTDNEKTQPITTYSLDNPSVDNDIPAWLRAVEDRINR